MLTDLFQNLREFSISKQGIEIADVIIPDQSIAELRSSEKICLVQSFQELLDFDDTVDFAAKSPKVGTKITQKGGRVITCDPSRTYPCGNACRSHSKDCKNPIEGQAKNYAGFLEQQSKKEGKIKDTKTSNKYNVAEVRKRFLDGEEMTIDQPDGTTARVKYVKDKDVNYLETYKGDNDKPTSRPLMTTEEAEKYIDDMFKPQIVKAFGDPNPRFNTDSDKKLTNKAIVNVGSKAFSVDRKYLDNPDDLTVSWDTDDKGNRVLRIDVQDEKGKYLDAGMSGRTITGTINDKFNDSQREKHKQLRDSIVQQLHKLKSDKILESRELSKEDLSYLLEQNPNLKQQFKEWGDSIRTGKKNSERDRLMSKYGVIPANEVFLKEYSIQDIKNVIGGGTLSKPKKPSKLVDDSSDLDARRKGKAVAEKQVKDPISTTKQKKDDRDGAVDTTRVEKLEPRSAAQQEEDYYELGIPRDKQAKDGLPSTLERIKKFGYTPTEQELTDLKSGDGRLYLKAWESIEDNSFDIRAEKVRGIRKEQKQIESQIDSLQAQKNDLLNEAEKIRDARARRYGRSAAKRVNKGLDAVGGDGRSMNDPKVRAQIYKLEDDARRFDPQINDLIAKRNNLLIDARDLGAESIENPNNPRNQKPKEEPKSETLDKTKKSATGVKNIKIKFDDGETVDLTPDDIKVISGKDNLSLSEKKRLAKSPALVTLSKRIAETGDPALMKKYEGFALSGGVGTLDGSIPRAMLRDIDIHRAKKEIESAKESGDKEKQATWEAELKRVEIVAKTNLAGDPINTGKSATNKSRTAKEDKPALETYGSKGRITELTKDNESQELDDFLNTPSKNHQMIYIGKDGSSFNSKRVIRSKDLGYITGDKARLLKKDKDAQFKQGLQSLETNREIGTTAYIKTPDGKFYESSDRSRMAKAITADEIRKRGLSDKPVEDKDPNDPEFSERPSQNFTWSRENIERYKTISERRQLKA